MRARATHLIVRHLALDPRTLLGAKFRSVSKRRQMEETVLFLDDVREGLDPECIMGRYIVQGAPMQINMFSDHYHACLNRFSDGERDPVVLFGEIARAAEKEIFLSDAMFDFERRPSVTKCMRAYESAVQVFCFFAEGGRLDMEIANTKVASMVKLCESLDSTHIEFARVALELSGCCAVVDEIIGAQKNGNRRETAGSRPSLPRIRGMARPPIQRTRNADYRG